MKTPQFGFVVGFTLVLTSLATAVEDNPAKPKVSAEANASVASEAVKDFSYAPAAKTPASPSPGASANPTSAPAAASPVLAVPNSTFSSSSSSESDEGAAQVTAQPLQMATYHVKEMPDRTYGNLNHALLVERYLSRPSLYAVDLTSKVRFEFIRPPEPAYATEPGVPANNASGNPTARFPLFNFTW